MERAVAWLVPLALAIVGHEVGHAWAAARLGDPTAAEQGRLSLNPLRHVDPLGTLVVPVVLWLLTPIVFGWARPVPVTPARLRSPRRDMALVALAGPAANFAMALGWAVGWRVTMELQAGVALVWMCLIGVSLNLAIGALNLLPVLPLDGGRVLGAMLPPRYQRVLARLTVPVVVVLLALLFFGDLGAIIGAAIAAGSDLMLQLVARA